MLLNDTSAGLVFMDACIGGLNLGPLESEFKKALGNVLTTQCCNRSPNSRVIFPGVYAKKPVYVDKKFFHFPLLYSFLETFMLIFYSR